MMLTPAQLRAARGLLDWTRSDLAKAANLSPETIKNIEHGAFKPQDATAQAIVRAFAMNDVEFTENEGVRKATNGIINYIGKDGFRKYADDIYQILMQTPEDRKIFIFGNNDKEFVDALGSYAPIHLKRMSELEGLEFKALVGQGINVFVTKYIKYRRLNQIGFAIPFSVYENRLDFIMYGEGADFPKVVVVKSNAIAAAYREQFALLWKSSEPIE